MNVLNNIQENLPLIIAAIILVVVQNFLKRRRGPAASQPGLVQDLLGEVRYNLGLVNVFSHQYQAKRFVATMWKLDKDKLDFLPQPLQESLSNAFAMVEDFNQHPGHLCGDHSSVAHPSRPILRKSRRIKNRRWRFLEGAAKSVLVNPRTGC